MGNPSLLKCRPDGNIGLAIFALSTIILWIAAGIEAQSAENQFRGIDSPAPYGDSHHQHRSHQKRHVDPHSSQVAAPVGDKKKTGPTVTPGHCNDTWKRANDLHREISLRGRHEVLAETFSLCTIEDIQMINQTHDRIYEESLIGLLQAKYSSIFWSYTYTSMLIYSRAANPFQYLAIAYRNAIYARDYDRVLYILTPQHGVSTGTMKSVFNYVYEENGGELVDGFLGALSQRSARIVRSLLSGARRYPGDPDQRSSACEDAEKIIQDRETGVWKKEDSVDDDFHEILVRSSYEHLRRVSECFRDRTGRSLKDVIKNEHTLRTGMEAYYGFVYYAEDKAAYFAAALNKALTGVWKVEGEILNLIIPWRAEIDLEDIKIAYQRMFQTSLHEDVALGTSHEYKDLLLALIGA